MPERALHRVKLLHTVACVFLAGSTLAVPVCGWLGRYRPALFFSGIVVVEILVLWANGWKCPLTPVAARYTDDRRPNFDIYLPEWLARFNKEIFGTIFVLGALLTWACWMGWVGTQ